MSYDIYLFKPDDGESVEDAFERLFSEDEDGDESEPSAEREVLKARLADALIAANPLLESFQFDYAAVAKSLKTTEEEARRQWRHIELNGPEDGNGIQITIEDGKATVTVPYWHEGDDAKRVFEEIWKYLKVFQTEAGYLAFDPQLECPLDLSKDPDEMIQTYTGFVGTMNTKFVASNESSVSDKPQPWWKFW